MILDEYNIGRIAKLAKMNRPHAVGLISLPGRLPDVQPFQKNVTIASSTAHQRVAHCFERGLRWYSFRMSD